MSDLLESDTPYTLFLDFTNCPFNIFGNVKTKCVMKPSSVFRILSKPRGILITNELTIPDTLEEQMKSMTESDEIYDFR